MKPNWLLLIPVFLAAMVTPQAEIAPAPRSAEFSARHELNIQIPPGAGTVRIWFTMPQPDPFQEINDFKIEAPFRHRLVRDSAGNQLLYFEAKNPAAKPVQIAQTFQLKRCEQINRLLPENSRPFTPKELLDLSPHLEANEHVVIDQQIRDLARQIVGSEQNPVRIARTLYDWVLHNVDYWVKDPLNKKPSPVGSTLYCLTNRTGNCTDFSSLWISLARASGLPTRLVYGSMFKPELDSTDQDLGYHCWPEFYLPELGWIPHDVAMADIFLGNFELTADNSRLIQLATAYGYKGPDIQMIHYYFGNLDERRIIWSRGRDLVLAPPQNGGPLNALIKAYVEVDGKELPEQAGWSRKLTYREITDQ